MSNIEWTDETWNPVTGCTKVSAGCKNCYAEALAPRVFAGQVMCQGAGGKAYFDSIADARDATGAFNEWEPRRFTDVRWHHDRLDKPLRWRKPRRVFVNSMSDLFHEDVPDDFIEEVFARMAIAPKHTFQILTKRPRRMREFLASPDYGVVRKRRHRINQKANACSEPPDHDWAWNAGWPLPNVWLGVSCEDQAAANERIPILLDTPAAVRFVSAEPLLGPIDFVRCAAIETSDVGAHGFVDWVIVGGESGPKARPCDVSWIRSIVEQCREAEVACFVKQLGRRPYDPAILNGAHWETRDKKGGRPSEWPEDLRVREWPTATGSPMGR